MDQTPQKIQNTYQDVFQNAIVLLVGIVACSYGAYYLINSIYEFVQQSVLSEINFY